MLKYFRLEAYSHIERHEFIDLIRGEILNASASILDYHQFSNYSVCIILEIPIKKGLKEVKILNNYAIASVGVGKVKEAAEIYEKILKENPSQREVMLNYSILLIENMQKNKEGLDLLNRLKFVGAPQEARDTIKNLEIKAKAGLQ